MEWLSLLIPFLLILPLGFGVFLTPAIPDDYLADDDPDAWMQEHTWKH